LVLIEDKCWWNVQWHNLTLSYYSAQ